jgi:hypothetical protein
MDTGDRLKVVLALGIAELRAKEIVKKDVAFLALTKVIACAGLREGGVLFSCCGFFACVVLVCRLALLCVHFFLTKTKR